jgi:alpha-beta hydrolase superfamily lysophospholipase
MMAIDMRPPLAVSAVAVVLGCLIATIGLPAQTRETLSLRGHPQSLYIYGSPAGAPIVLSSGDGGWIHLAPHVAEFLAARGFYIVGFDVRAYLEDFTSGAHGVRPSEEPADYRVLSGVAAAATGRTPILVGVSEGAGLSVLAATDPETRAGITGVIGLGLPDLNELAWRWRDMLIYVTHKTPNEPTFSAAAIVGLVAPLPLAEIHASHDEFVSVDQVRHVMEHAGAPKRLWIVDASDHRFSDSLPEFDRRLIEAIAWVNANQPR